MPNVDDVTAKRLVNFTLEIGEIPGVTTDRISGVKKVGNYASDVIKEQNYANSRLESLMSLGKSAGKTVFTVSLLSVVIGISVAAVQSFWLTMQVKKRL